MHKVYKDKYSLLKWSFKTVDLLKEVQFIWFFFYDRTRLSRHFNIGDCLIEVTAWAGLTLLISIILTYVIWMHVVDNTAMLQLSSVLTAMWALKCDEVSHNFLHRLIFEEIHSCVHSICLWIQFGDYISEIYYITD